MPKKKKKSKKALKKARLAEQKRKEEEERRRKEEEERLARIAEKERIQRELEEKIRREEEAKRLAAERIRIGEESKIFDSVKKAKELELKDLREKVEEKDKWTKFLECSDLPNPNDESDLNSYISIWESNENRNVELDFSDCKKGIAIYNIINSLYHKARVQENAEGVKFYSAISHEFSRTLLETLDKLSAHIIQYNDQFLEKNSQFSYSSEEINYDMWVNLTKKAKRNRNVDFKAVQATVELSVKMTLTSLAVRLVQLCYNPLQSLITKDDKKRYENYWWVNRKEDIDKGQYYPIGPILFIELLEIPPSAKKEGDWTIREVTSLAKEVVRIDGRSLDNNQKPSPTKISFVIPDSVIIRDEFPRIGWWDKENRMWSVRGISDIEYDENRRVVFSSLHLSTALAVVHPRTYDAPFSKWLITPLGRETALFVLRPKTKFTGVNFSIFIKIYEAKCCLLRPNNVPQLKYLLGKYMAPTDLLAQLSERGVNLTLEDCDAKYEQPLIPKESDLESKMHYEMSYVSNICTMASSRWNQDAGDTRAIFQCKKVLTDPLSNNFDDEDDDEILAKAEKILKQIDDTDDGNLWYSVSYETPRAGFIKQSEHAEKYDPQLLDGTDTHLNLFLCLQQVQTSDNEVEKRVDSGSVLVAQTVRHLLNATRPMSFS